MSYRILTFFLIGQLSLASLHAQIFDTNFGSDGVSEPVINDTLGWIVHGNLEILDDGSVLTSGMAIRVIDGSIADSGIGVVKYTPSGVVDDSYGNGGYFYSQVPNGPNSFWQISFSDFTVDSQNRGLICAKVIDENLEPQLGDWNRIEIIRLSEQGDIDVSFNSGGRLLVDSIQWGSLAQIFPSVESINPNLFAISYSKPSIQSRYRLRLYDVTQDSFSDLESLQFADTLWVRPYNLEYSNGFLYLSGIRQVESFGENGFESFVSKFGIDGALDTSFGNEGIASISVELMDSDSVLLPVSTHVDNEGNVYSMCQLLDNSSDSPKYLAKILPNGNLDSSFGASGISEIPIFNLVNLYNSDPLRSCDNHLYYMTGLRASENVTASPMGIARIDANGVLDNNFGEGGIYELSDTTQSHQAQSIGINNQNQMLINYSTSGSSFARIGRLDDCISPSSLSELETSIYHLSPNPTSSILNIETLSNSSDVHILIMDRVGRVIYRQNIEVPASLDLSNFKSGLYLMQIINTETQTTHTIKVLKE